MVKLFRGDLNEVIKERRLELGYFQEQFGVVLNFTSLDVNHWEKGYKK